MYIMRCLGFRSTSAVPCLNESYLKELQRTEDRLKQKEKELVRKEKNIQNKLAKLSKTKSSRAEADLRAAAKLKRAKKNLLVALDARDAIKKRNTKIKNHFPKEKVNKKKYETLTRLSMPFGTNRKSIARLSIWNNPLNYFSDLLNKPQSQKKRRLAENNHASYLLQSLLQQIIGCPCSSQSAHTSRSDRSVSCHKSVRYREQSSWPRQTAWEKAAGDCYLMSFMRPPQQWAFCRPQTFNRNICIKDHCKSFGYALLCMTSALFWLPCLLICKCCFCSCCADC